jgi:autotransporter-associated beta strand protein
LPRKLSFCLPRYRSAPALCAAIFHSFILAQVASAQTWTREGPGTFLWSDPANWTAPPISSPQTHLTFGSLADVPYVAQNDLPSPFVLNRLDVGGAAQVRITGAPLTFVGTAALPAALTQTSVTPFRIDAPIQLATPITFTTTIPGTLFTLAGPISGTGGLIVDGNVSLSLGRFGQAAGPLTFAGGTLIRSAALELFGDSISLGSGVVTLASGRLTAHPINPLSQQTIVNELRVEGESIARTENSSPLLLSNHVTLAGTLRGPSMIFPAGKQLRIDQSVVAKPSIIPLQSTPAALTQINSDIVDVGIGPASAFNPLTLRAGTTDLVVSGAANTYAGGTIIEPNDYGSGAFVQLAPQSSLGRSGATVKSNARLRLTAMTNLAPGRKVVVEKGGIVELGGALGVTTQSVSLLDPASEGMLALTNSPASGLDLAGLDKLILGTLTTAAIVNPFAPAASAYRVAAPGGANLHIRREGAAPVLGGANALVVGGIGMNGIVYMPTANTYTGGTTLLSGSLQVWSDALGLGDVRIEGGALLHRIAPDALGPAAKLIVADGAAYLGMPNRHSGGTLVTGGRLAVEHPQALGSGNLTLAGGLISTALAVPNPVTLTGDVQLEGGDQPTGALAGPITLAGNVTLRPRNIFTLAGDIARSPGDPEPLSIISSGALIVSGVNNIYPGGTTISGDGAVLVAPGSRLGAGDVTLNSGELINLSPAGPVTGASKLIVRGGVAKMRSLTSYAGGTIVTGGMIEADADFALGDGQVRITGGVLKPTGAPRTLGGTVIVQGAGAIDLAGQDLTLANLSGDGSVRNSGAVQRSLTITGALAPADYPLPAIGTLTISQSAGGSPATLQLVPGSVTRLQLAGTIPGLSHDRIVSTGPVLLHGTLELTRDTAYHPTPGQTLDVVFYGSSEGRFDTITGLAAGNGLAFAPQYLSDRLRLLVTFQGDANADLVVNHADFLALRAHFGQRNADWSTGDFTGDGIVTFADYQALALNFGRSAANPQALAPPPTLDATDVPEPAALALLTLAISNLCLTRAAAPRSGS